MGEDEGNKLGEGDKDEDGGGRKTEEKGKKLEDRVGEAGEGEALGEGGIIRVKEVPGDKSWDGRPEELVEGDKNRKGDVYDVNSDEKIYQGEKITEERREEMTKIEKTRPIGLGNCYSIEMTVRNRDKPEDSKTNKDCKIPDRNAVKEEGEAPGKREVEERAVSAKVESKTVEDAHVEKE